MICEKEGHKGEWCCYWFQDKCNYRYNEGITECLSASLAPLGSDYEWLWDMMSLTELRKHMDVLQLLHEDAVPNDFRDNIGVAECEEVKLLCERHKRYVDVVIHKKMEE